MYICECCGAVFPCPVVAEENTGRSLERRWACPDCGEGPVRSADPCPVCGGWCRSGEGLCRACRAGLKERFCRFVEDLTAEEQETLDGWLDGESILACRDFR